MRYSISILVLFFALIGCSTDSKDTMNLSGNIKGLKRGTLLLQKFEDTVLITIDSVKLEGKSEFKFSERVESPEIYYLYVQIKDGTLKDDRITFFGEPGNIGIYTNLKHFGSGARISGSKNDSILRDYNKIKQRYISKNLEIIEKSLKSKKLSDSASEKFREQQIRLGSNKHLATINFAMNNNEYEVAPYLVLSEAYNANVKYLDTVYNVLSPKVKNSKYGKELESFIKERKKVDTIEVR